MSAPIPPRAPSEPSAPPRHCPACARGHYVAVRFCPFCGAAQATAPGEPSRKEPWPKEPAPARDEATHYFVLETSAPVPARVPAPSPARDSARPPADPRAAATPRRRARPALLGAGILAVGIAAAALLGRGPGLPEPARIDIGPAWTGVALGPLRSAPRLRLTADAPFSLRLDGERVQRIGVGGRAVVRPRGLRTLELRAARGRVMVRLTPAE